LREAGEPITWEQSQAISAELVAKATAFDEQAFMEFMQKKGLYFLCYKGHELSRNLFDEAESPIVYIGRVGTDSIRHWRNNTGISTVRRSLAALLASSLALIAIPRSCNPKDNDRYTNYRLNEESEEELTKWIKENIEITTWALPEEDIPAYYQALMNYNTPKFNFQDNPNNTFGQQIKSYRKKLAAMAMTYDVKKQISAAQ
jgi:hypothetical protein